MYAMERNRIPTGVELDSCEVFFEVCKSRERICDSRVAKIYRSTVHGHSRLLLNFTEQIIVYRNRKLSQADYMLSINS